MSRDEIQKLLGGYASNTLSEAERSALMEAALEDQELFDALAKEQALREVLDDPAARRQLIAALAPSRSWAWLRRPAPLAMAGGFAALVIVSVILVRPKPPAARQEIVAEAIPPRPATPPQGAEAMKAEAPSPAKKTKTFVAPGAISAPRPAAAAPAPLTPPTLAPAGVNLESSTAGTLAGPTPAPPPAVRLASGQVRSGNEVMMRRLRALTMAKARERGLEYTIMLVQTNGTYSPAPSGTVLHSGDSVRLQVTSPSTGTLYLYQLASNGDTNLLATQAVEKDQNYVLPSSGALESDRPSQMRLMLVLAPPVQPAMQFAAGRQSDTVGLTAAGRVVRNITLDFQAKP